MRASARHRTRRTRAPTEWFAGAVLV